MEGHKVKLIIRKLMYVLLNPEAYLRSKSMLSKLKAKNEKVVLLVTCGPSLELVKKLPGFNQIVDKHYLICMKQAYNDFQNQTDIHIVNEIRYPGYEYGPSKPLILSVGKSSPNITSDAHFPIIDCSYSAATFVTNDYDGDNLRNKPYFRQSGIGVMYELGLFIPQLLNCKKLIIVGFDMNQVGKYHYYDDSEAENAKAYSVDNKEIMYNQETTPHLEDWLNSVNIDVALFSPLSALPFKQKISTIEELNDFITN